MEVLHEPPALDSFTPLTTHQSQTPTSFYEGPPVLHHRAQDAQLVISTHDLHSTPALSNLRAPTDLPTRNGHTDSNHDRDHDDPNPDIVLHGLDIYVTSERFIIYSSRSHHGLAIPYPSISLHAIQRLHLPPHHLSHPHATTQPPSPDPDVEVRGLFLQISTTADAFDDRDATLSLTVVPAPSAPPPAAAAGPPAQTTTEEEEIQALFAAVSTCSNLHPDAVDQESMDGEEGGVMDGDSDGDGAGYGAGPGYGYGEGDGDVNGGQAGQGGLPPPMPGSGGWITAENVGEFFDGEGDWRGRGLGPGAGVVRGRGEVEGVGEGRGDGEGEGEGQGEGREEGAGEETKWRRTG